jgi:hypothetical protein
LRKPDHAREGEAPEVILINAHDGSCAYKLMAGMFRFACANGIIVGEQWKPIHVPHKGRDTVAKVIEGTYEVVELVEDKLKGRTVVAHATERPTGENVVDLMEALRKSIEGSGPGRRARAAGRRGHRRRDLGRAAQAQAGDGRCGMICVRIRGWCGRAVDAVDPLPQAGS